MTLPEDKRVGAEAEKVAGIPTTRHWLFPPAQRPKDRQYEEVRCRSPQS